MRLNLLSLLLMLCAVLLLTRSADAVDEEHREQQQAIVIIGAAGPPQFSEMFAVWSGRWAEACERASIECITIGEANLSDEKSSDKQRVTQTLRTHAGTASREPLWLVMIGHGTFDGRTALFNLRGPDISAEELAVSLENARRPLIIINCASSSAPFINAMSGENRVVVSATKDGAQYQLARFGDALSAAVSGTEADLNHDGQVSLLEACVMADRRTAEFYESEGRLATEHALLDDNGDARGTRCSAWTGARLELSTDDAPPDGLLARRFHLIRSDEERQLTVTQRAQRDELEQQLAELRGQREALADDVYLNRLESLLLPLAQLYRAAEQAAAETPAESDSSPQI